MNTKLIIKFYLIIFSLVCSSCAVSYRDSISGVDHIWGFGHLSMKVTAPQENKQALIQRTTLIGFSAGINNGSFGLNIGQNQMEHILIFDENTSIVIKRPPSNDFFNFKIGSRLLDFEKTTDN